MIKGLEALFVEAFLSARNAGVDKHLLASLEDSYPDFPWRKTVGYMISRTAVHGKRRAAEMRGSAEMLTAIGLGGDMSAASARVQDWMAALDLGASFTGDIPQDYETLADAALAKIKERSK